MNDKIREVALRVAGEMSTFCRTEYDEYTHECYEFSEAELPEFLSRCLAELSKDVEPVCWITPCGEGWMMRYEPPVTDTPLGWQALYEHPPLTEQDKLDAEPTLTCPHCKVDRLKEPCPDLSRCKFVATAYSNKAMENGK